MNTIIIDTREPYEFESGHVEGAINIPPHKFAAGVVPEELAGVDNSDEIILYCRSGMRSNTVGHLLRGFGFENIINGTNQQHVERLLKDR